MIKLVVDLTLQFFLVLELLLFHVNIFWREGFLSLYGTYISNLYLPLVLKIIILESRPFCMVILLLSQLETLKTRVSALSVLLQTKSPFQPPYF